jgi:phosphoglycolate phosphatase
VPSYRPSADLLRAPRAMLFDWDNTLVDSWPTIHATLNHLMRAMALPEWSLAETKANARHSLRDRFPRLFGAHWQEALDLYLEHFRAVHLERLTPLPGREEMLRELAGQGRFLGIVSNKTGEMLRREVAHLGWSNLFDSIVGAGDAAVDKPACEPVHLALAPSGIVAGDEVWLIGDSAIDMECAINSGCVAVLLGEDGAAAEFARFAPHLSFADAASLLRSLEGLRSPSARPSS